MDSRCSWGARVREKCLCPGFVAACPSASTRLDLGWYTRLPAAWNGPADLDPAPLAQAGHGDPGPGWRRGPGAVEEPRPLLISGGYPRLVGTPAARGQPGHGTQGRGSPAR